MDVVLNGLLAVCVMSGVAGAHSQGSAGVLVFGGTGRLGAPIARLLVEAGYPVTVFTRPASNRDRLAGLDVKFMTGDLMDAESVSRAIHGTDFRFVIDATSRGASRESFYDTAMRNMLQALTESHVHQFILHGSIGAGDNMNNFPDFGFERMRELMQAKGRAESLLKSSGIGYTIIRNGMVRRDGTPATGTARLTGDDRAIASVTRLDLAALTLQCLGRETCMNRTFHAVDVANGKQR